tara:strand:- start:48 stop:611 length:564 start_codon:yes stop_codon:yes gene_type:complete
VSEKEKSEFSEEEIKLINQVFDESFERNPLRDALREERDKRWRRHKVDQLQGYIRPNEPFPEWEFEEGFRSLKKADQWLLGKIYYSWERFIIYIQSFFYIPSNNHVGKTFYNIFMFGLFLLPPIALLLYLIVLFGYEFLAVSLGILVLVSVLIILFLYFLWKILDITIGQTIIGTALVIWFSYLLIN